MYPILRKEILSDTVNLIEVDAPLVARKARPGQFVIVRINETGERIPLTIADFDPHAGSLTLIFQKVGKCVMPKEGVFGKVIKGGTITPGDKISVIKKPVGNL